MRGLAGHLSISVAMAVALALAAAAAADAHSVKAKKRELPQQPAAVEQEPRKRQNFRARRADEFPPWEGFEDCPMALPCVGMVSPYHRRN